MLQMMNQSQLIEFVESETTVGASHEAIECASLQLGIEQYLHGHESVREFLVVWVVRRKETL